MEHFEKILNKMLFWQQETDRLRTQNADGQVMDAVCQRLAHHYLGLYLAAIINADAESERMLANQLAHVSLSRPGADRQVFDIAHVGFRFCQKCSDRDGVVFSATAVAMR